MEKQFSDVFETIGVPLESQIVSNEEFHQPLSNEILKERVSAVFTQMDESSFYSYGEDTIQEVIDHIETIYEKERERSKQEDANSAIFWIRLITASLCVIVGVAYWIVLKKTVKLKDTSVKNKEKKLQKNTQG